MLGSVPRPLTSWVTFFQGEDARRPYASAPRGHPAALGQAVRSPHVAPTELEVGLLQGICL